MSSQNPQPPTPHPQPPVPHLLLIGGLTAVFVGYLSVWLPGPGVGLQLLGVELGEWVKFLGVGQNRDLFYLPPITLGLMLAVWTMGWPNGRWQTWAARGLAVLISLLAFPAIEDLLGPAREQYTGRVYLIGLVLAVALLSGQIGPWLAARRPWLPWLLLALLGLLGAIAPTWMYGQVAPYVNRVVGLPVGMGWGVWLNAGGNLLVTAVAVWQLWKNTDRGEHR
ncbi:MAG: hypothetical protein KC441_09135 [Anaerolineales bacterium]|nr:hypothetical protein [Anaerolineales bacterium]